MSVTHRKPILVAGATGYIGGRLVPALLMAGYRVRALCRAPEKIMSRPWATHPDLEVRKADLFDRGETIAGLAGCRAAYYLVHSMGPGVADFAAADRVVAENFVAAAEAAALERIIYLGGLGEEDSGLSAHLRSRTEVGRVLRRGRVPVTILRAAVIIGSGSASFEILRYLVDRLPVMITPRWVSTPCQPIGIRNVLHYLIGCLDLDAARGETFDIGQEEVVTYRRLMEVYASEAGLRKRLILPVPLLSPHLSSYWISLVTPVPSALAHPLVEGLRNPVVCHDFRLRALLPQKLLDCRDAIRLALDRTQHFEVETSWRDAGAMPRAEWRMPGDPAWAGGTEYSDSWRIVIAGDPQEVWRVVTCIGGQTGWYHADWLWKLRGMLDRMVGGIGLQRGRRCSTGLYPGDALDFWRVIRIEKPHHLQLAAEMKLPGQALLEFRIDACDPGQTALQLTARFLPRGLPGLLYWLAVMPLHRYVFKGMLRGIGRSLGKPIVQGPVKMSSPPGPN